MRRRTKGEGSLFKPKNCRYWYASYYENGTQKKVSTQQTSRTEALRKLREFIGDNERGLPSPADLQKLRYGHLRELLLEDYRAEQNRSLKQRQGSFTISRLGDLDRFFNWTESNLGAPVAQMNSDASRKFALWRRNEGARKKQDVSTATINRGLALLRRMLYLAREHGKIAVVPKIKMLPEPPARQGFLDVEIFHQLLAELPSRLRALIAFLYYCAMRVNEARQLDWSQLDMTQGDHGIIRLKGEQAKTGEMRVVPLHAEVAILLRDVEPKTGKIFNATNLRSEWARACVAVGLGTIEKIAGAPGPGRKVGYVWYRYKGPLVHDLRRSAVRNMVNAGVPERVAMAISGHKTRAVFDRYHIVSPGDVVNAMRKIEIGGLGKDKVKFGGNFVGSSAKLLQ